MFWTQLHSWKTSNTLYWMHKSCIKIDLSNLNDIKLTSRSQILFSKTWSDEIWILLKLKKVNEIAHVRNYKNLLIFSAICRGTFSFIMVRSQKNLKHGDDRPEALKKFTVRCFVSAVPLALLARYTFLELSTTFETLSYIFLECVFFSILFLHHFP